MEKFGLAAVFLLLSTCSSGREKTLEIKLTIKHNGQTVTNPAHVTLSAGTHVASVSVIQHKFEIPAEISRAKSWRLSLLIKDSQIEIGNLSPRDLSYENWILHFADRRYSEELAYAIPRGAHIYSSCVLVLDSEHIDPGVVLFQNDCRSKVKDSLRR